MLLFSSVVVAARLLLLPAVSCIAVPFEKAYLNGTVFCRVCREGQFGLCFVVAFKKADSDCVLLLLEKANPNELSIIEFIDRIGRKIIEVASKKGQAKPEKIQQVCIIHLLSRFDNTRQCQRHFTSPHSVPTYRIFYCLCRYLRYNFILIFLFSIVSLRPHNMSFVHPQHEFCAPYPAELQMPCCSPPRLRVYSALVLCCLSVGR